MLFVHHTFPGLTATFVYREARAIADRGVRLSHLSCKRPAGVVSDDARAFVQETFFVPPGWKPYFWGAVLWQVLRCPVKALRLMKRVMRGEREVASGSFGVGMASFLRGLYAAAFVRRRPEIGHLHAPHSTDVATIAMVAAEMCSLPWSFSSHTAFDDKLPREKMESASFVRSISDFDKKRLIARSSQAGAEKIHIIHCGINPEGWTFAPRKQLNDPARVLSVGTLQEKKGHSVLIDAAARLVERGIVFQLTIAGGGALSQALAEQVERLSLASAVELVGPRPQEEIRELYDQADVFALACVYSPDGDLDGIPVVLMEAMALGISCVSTSVSGIPELIGDGREGLLAPPGDADALAAHLEHLIADADFRCAAAGAGRRKVEEEFDIRKSAERFEQLFALNMPGGDR